MSEFEKGRDYEELDFPRNWPNDQRVQFLNELLADTQTNRSVELLLRGGRIVVRTWFVDHLD